MGSGSLSLPLSLELTRKYPRIGGEGIHYTTIFELDPQVVSPGVIQTKETFVGKWLSPLEQELLACRALWGSLTLRRGLVEGGLVP